jgi:hypothetical protein
VAAGLEQDDRLDAGGRTQRAHEAAGVTDAFDVHQDVVGAVVVDQVVEDFAEIDVGRHAQRNDRREADLVALAQSSTAEHMAPDCETSARLPTIGGDLGEGGVEAEVRANDAEAVGAEDADVVAAGDLQHLALQRGADVAGFGEAGGDDDDVRRRCARIVR